MKVIFDLVIKLLSALPGDVKKNGRIKPGTRVAAILLSGVLVIAVLGAGAAACAFAIRMFAGGDNGAPTAVTASQTVPDNKAALIADTLNNAADTSSNNDTITAETNTALQADTIDATPPVTISKTTDTVKKRPATWNSAELLSFIKKEEQSKNTTITNVTIHITSGSNSMGVARQIAGFLKQHGYNVNSDIGMVVTEHPLKGINVSLSNNGVLDIQVGNME